MVLELRLNDGGVGDSCWLLARSLVGAVLDSTDGVELAGERCLDPTEECSDVAASELLSPAMERSSGKLFASTPGWCVAGTPVR